jgi:hypothetical protein
MCRQLLAAHLERIEFRFCCFLSRFQFCLNSFRMFLEDVAAYFCPQTKSTGLIHGVEEAQLHILSVSRDLRQHVHEVAMLVNA